MHFSADCLSLLAIDLLKLYLSSSNFIHYAVADSTQTYVRRYMQWVVLSQTQLTYVV